MQHSTEPQELDLEPSLEPAIDRTPWDDWQVEELAKRLRLVSEEFRIALRDLRENSQLSQRQLAREMARIGMHLDATAITRIESGKRSVRIEEAWAIAAALRVELDTLVPTSTSTQTVEERIALATQHLEWARRRAEAFAAEVEEDVRLIENLQKQLAREAQA